MSGMGFRLYRVSMPDNAAHTIVTGPAVPLTLVVQRDGGHWCLRAYYHGNTIRETLNPTLVAERYFSKAEVPLQAAWVDLWKHVALAVDDLSTLSGGIARVE